MANLFHQIRKSTNNFGKILTKENIIKTQENKSSIHFKKLKKDTNDPSNENISHSSNKTSHIKEFLKTKELKNFMNHLKKNMMHFLGCLYQMILSI